MPEKSEQKHDVSARSGGLIAVGRIVKACGLGGELKIESLSDIPDRFSKLNEVFVEFENGPVEKYTIASVRMRNNGLYITLDGVEDRSAAEKFRGAYLCIDSGSLARLPSDMYYEFDLIGMEARSPGGGIIGTVVRIERYPANDVIVVETDRGELPVPALRDIVLEVDIQEKHLTMDIPDGLPVYPKGAR